MELNTGLLGANANPSLSFGGQNGLNFGNDKNHNHNSISGGNGQFSSSSNAANGVLVDGLGILINGQGNAQQNIWFCT